MLNRKASRGRLLSGTSRSTTASSLATRVGAEARVGAASIAAVAEPVASIAAAGGGVATAVGLGGNLAGGCKGGMSVCPALLKTSRLGCCAFLTGEESDLVLEGGSVGLVNSVDVLVGGSSHGQAGEDDHGKNGLHFG